MERGEEEKKRLEKVKQYYRKEAAQWIDHLKTHKKAEDDATAIEFSRVYKLYKNEQYKEAYFAALKIFMDEAYNVLKESEVYLASGLEERWMAIDDYLCKKYKITFLIDEDEEQYLPNY